MPELPEVQTTVDGLNRTTKGKIILDVWSDYFLRTKNKKRDNIKNRKYFEYFRKEVVGEKVKSAERRGKNILIHLTGGKTMLIHMKMTGHLLYGKYKWNGKKWESDEKPLSDPFNKFIHLIFTLSDKHHLAFSDMRKFAKVILFETDNRDEITDLNILGPEPLIGLSPKTLQIQLSKKPNGKIKTVLMNQSVIAGIGNIYSDEILWDSGIHPERTVAKITIKEINKIFQSLKKILEKSVDMGGDSMSDYRNIYGEKGGFQYSHKAYRQTKQKCRRKKCKGIIIRKVVGGRSAHFCDTHQK